MNFVHQYIYAPIKVLFNKSHSYIKEYINTNNSEIIQENQVEIERYYDRIDTYIQIISFFKSPTHIIDNIYVGNARNAASYYTLEDNNIKMIINVTENIPIYYPEIYTYHHIKIKDDNNESIKSFLENSYNRIKDFQKNNNNCNILIHCFMGASRSVSILIYYILKERLNKNKKININKTIQFIKEKRSIINPTKKLIKDIEESLNIL
jgi:hypothetical protein